MFFSRELPATVAVVGAIVWVVIGVVLALYFGAARPETLERSTHAFGGEIEGHRGTPQSTPVTQ